MADNRAENSLCDKECTGIANVMELLNEDEEDLTDVNEAANLETSTYDAISADLLDSPIILPTHLRLNNLFLPSYYNLFAKLLVTICLL